MKIKIGNVIYDSEQQPIMVILTQKDKENITNMPPDATRYCEFPDGSDPVKIELWMSEHTT